jgi:DNA-directed RNA polymerase subunit K/omega
MNMEYMDKAQEKVTNTPMLVNLISYRTRQLNAGARPMVKKDHPEQDNSDVVLKEICEGLLTVEMAFSQETKEVAAFDFETSIIL